MGLVDEIIDSAIDNDVALSVILRKCLVVATQLGNDRLKAWVLGELNGYNDDEELPQYRVINVQVKGLLTGPFGAQINDQPLASTILDDEHRSWATTSYLRQGVAAYENILAEDNVTSLRSFWPGDLVLKYQTKFIQGYVLNRAWQEMHTSDLAAVVDTVRNRLLGFALELREEIGDAEKPLDQIPTEGVEKAVTTIIYGQNIIMGNVAGDVQQSGQINISQGDFDALRLVLEKIGVPPDELQALDEAIKQDKEAGAENGFGSRVKGWLGKAGNAVAKVAADTATDTLKKAVMDCLGLP